MRWFSILAILFICFATSAFWYFGLHESPLVYAAEDGRIDTGRAIQYWKTQIAEQGAESSHAEMVRDAMRLPVPFRHTLAHSFGSALYETGGLETIRYCGDEFLYGCYHQFIGLSTNEFGIPVIRKLKEACDQSSEFTSTCAHGIGHGLLSAFGYEERDLTKALDECRTVYEKPSDRHICADGVFMEFNLLEIATLEEGRTPREFTAEGAYGPCLSVEEEFVAGCIYELADWWYTTITPSSPEPYAIYKDMGALCRALPLTNDRRAACFVGIGFPAAQRELFDVRRIKAACGAASEDESEDISCKAGVARRFYENGMPHERVCAALGLSGDGEAYCKTLVALPRYQGLELPAPHEWRP